MARSSFPAGQKSENAARIGDRWQGVHVSQGNNHKGIRFQVLPPTINSTSPPLQNPSLAKQPLKNTALEQAIIVLEITLQK